MLSLGRTNKVDYAALLAYRLYASRQVNSGLFGNNAPSLDEHDEVLLKPYRQIGQASDDLLNTYKLDAMYLHKLCYAAGNTQSWLMGLRNIRLPLLSWEVTRLVLSIPWRLRANRRLILHIIERMNPKLSSIPNDKGEPMRSLMLTTMPSYIEAWLSTGARTVPRIIQRCTNRFEGRKGVATKPPPASWLSIVSDARYIDSIFDSPLIKKILREVMSPSCTVDWMRTFYTLLTLELMFREVPSLNKKIAFSAGLDIPQ